MKAKQIPITIGAAAGTMVTRVESNSGKLLGFIRVVYVDFTAVLGMHTMYIVQQVGRNYGYKLCSTLSEAYQFLGVGIEELDHSDLGEYPYAEHTPSDYWRHNKSDALSQLQQYMQESHM
jgi:hypothetical protein